MNDTVKYAVLYVALIIVFLIITIILRGRKSRRILKAIKTAKPIPYEQFEEDWIIEREGRQAGTKGYKYEKFPGCYVMLIFEHPVRDGNYACYDDIYIGQSVNVTARVHSHFTGKGNGDVYADIKYGRSVYVQIIPCEREELNDMERALIEAYDATDSYNATKGGGTDWSSKKHGLFHRKK